jgi:hypothetical protein
MYTFFLPFQNAPPFSVSFLVHNPSPIMSDGIPPLTGTKERKRGSKEGKSKRRE